MRARSPVDLISVIPALLGFHPRESLVAISLHQPRQRLGFRIRVDLPPPQHVDVVADQVVGHLCAQEPDGVLLVAFSGAVEPADAVVAAVRERLAANGAEVVDALRCDGARFWSYVCDDEHCCPQEGTPYATDTNPLLAEAVFQGIEVLPNREELVERFAAVSGVLLDDVVAATDQVAERLERAAGVRRHDRDSDLLRIGIEAVTPVVDAFERDPDRRLDDHEAAVLSVWTSLIVVRDVLWSRLTRENAAVHLRMWRQVSARVVPPYEPAVLSLAAFAAWLSGSGSQAQCALDRVVAADPSYSMAALVQAVLSRCLSPDTWEQLDVHDVLRSVPGLE